jgi:hypothetical protein
MEFSALLDFFANNWIDEFLIWSVASASAIVGALAIVNSLEMAFDSDAG